jgi:hypothetical protein
VQLSISFLDQWHPELLGISAVSVKRGLSCYIVRNTSVDLYELPESIFEKAEDCKSELDAIMED